MNSGSLLDFSFINLFSFPFFFISNDNTDFSLNVQVNQKTHTKKEESFHSSTQSVLLPLGFPRSRS